MAVESVSGCLWNECPDQRGISVRMSVEWMFGWSWNPKIGRRLGGCTEQGGDTSGEPCCSLHPLPQNCGFTPPPRGVAGGDHRMGYRCRGRDTRCVQFIKPAMPQFLANTLCSTSKSITITLGSCVRRKVVLVMVKPAIPRLQFGVLYCRCWLIQAAPHC
jgi:hypothetical protein